MGTDERHPLTVKLAEALIRGLREEAADPEAFDERRFADSRSRAPETAPKAATEPTE